MIAPKYSYVSRGKLVTFFRNGDSHTKGLQTSVSGRHFVSYKTLLNWLDEKIPVNNGVKHILRIPDGFLINDVGQFQSGGNYAVSNNRHFIKTNYRTIKSDPSKRRDVIAPKNTSSDDFFNRRAKGAGNKMGSMYRSTPNLKNGALARKQNSYEENKNNNNNDFDDGRSSYGNNNNDNDFLNNSNNNIKNNASFDKNNDNDDSYYRNNNKNNNYFKNSNNKHRKTESRAVSQQEKQTFVAVNTPQHHNNVEPGYNNINSRNKYNNNNNNKDYNNLQCFNPNNNNNNENNSNNINMSRSDNKARIIELVSNINRKLKQRVIYNPRSHQSINEVYRDIENNILPISNPPVCALYTAYPPYIKVNSLSHLCEELSTHEKFIVCGSEGIPTELNDNNNTFYNNNSFGYNNNRYNDNNNDNNPYNNNNFNNSNNNNNQASHFSSRGFPTCNEKYCTCKLHVALVKALNNQ